MTDPDNVFVPRPNPRITLAKELKQTHLFHELMTEELFVLTGKAAEYRIPADQYIVQEDQPSEALFVLREGAVTVVHDAVGQPIQPLAHLRRGDVFGEMCLFSGTHTASVRTTAPCRIVRIPKEDLAEFLRQRPTVEEELRRVASERHHARIAAVVQLGRRREVRVRFYRGVALVLSDGAPHTAILESLSLGGIGLKDVPEPWRAGDEIHFGLKVHDHTLPLDGRIVWRRAERVGMELVKKHPNHDALIQLLISWLREETG